jgi:siderophore synthetase component
VTLKEFDIKASPSLELAQKAAVERILNAYLRETGFQRGGRVGSPLRIPLIQTGKVIVGELRYWSASGQHSYGSTFFVENGGSVPFVEINNEQLVGYLLDELAFIEPDPKLREIRRNSLHSHIRNSMDKTELYIKRYKETGGNAEQSLDFLRSEQSLYLGHPFHPTPKSSEGFSNTDLERYAPELGASFTLHYFAVSPELIVEQWVEPTGLAEGKPIGGEDIKTNRIIPKNIQQDAKLKLPVDQQRYCLLPCHPWQAEHLSEWKEVKKLRQEGKMVYLGPLGDPVFPTSSVRTVWDRENGYFYKLPLNVRITNFIRVNPLEQLKRTIDAAKVVALLKSEVEDESFGILMEHGYKTVSLPNVPDEENEKVMESFGVLFRESPIECRKEGNSLFVIASLLEALPGEDEPKLFGAIRESSLGETIDPVQWLRRYLMITMKPILNLFAETGISLEAHVQNGLLKLDKGCPAKLYVRDLEGISIDRDQALSNGWVGTVIPEDSPVLYTEQEAWNRLKYYFFVNHLGYVIHTVARYSEQDELVYWKVVRDVLQESIAESSSDRLRKYTKDLMESETLPAKANLVSRFQERGERPLYVDMGNPIYLCKVKG